MNSSFPDLVHPINSTKYYFLQFKIQTASDSHSIVSVAFLYAKMEERDERSPQKQKGKKKKGFILQALERRSANSDGKYYL